MIDYGILNKSIEHYSKFGFQRIESPWTVTEEILNLTKPSGAKDAFRLIHENKKGLVASGEQSFLYLYLKGFLPPGKFMTITPCYRFENFDFLHSKYFIKNELIQTEDVNELSLHQMINHARYFFSDLGFKNLEIIETSSESHENSTTIQSFDITWNSMELGSYGIRECKFLKWIFGTGCAENRTSNLLKLNGLSHK